MSLFQVRNRVLNGRWEVCDEARAKRLTGLQSWEVRNLSDALKLENIPRGMPSTFYKLGDEFKPFHPSASHVPPDYRDGWNRCWLAAKLDREVNEGSTK